ncbi:MAG: M48 family metalloprotease [Candidatus Methanoplasma sp.]|jgi:heat shock protein HtpX|nr:M48 family metalloprotease [Candidatus Methanoplasma sp.]
MKWHLKTAAMFVMMTLILLAVGTAIGYLFDSMWLGLIMMLGLSVVFNLYAYFFSKRSALRANRARIVTEAEEPRLHAIVRGVAAKAGVPMPEVGISELPMPNAFATGRNPKNAAVVATRGLLSLLPDDELEGVIAHEMAHVRNRDILVMSVASTMAAVLSYLSRYAIYAVMFGGNNNKNALSYVIAIALSITVPIAALLVQLGVSRSREYLADETGARITGNPRALARALRSIETGVNSPRNEYDSSSYADMWISDPVRKRSLFTKMFSTHPPMDDRIARLNDLAMKMDSGQIPRSGVSAKKKRSAYI